jgi:hypothetical protein
MNLGSSPEEFLRNVTGKLIREGYMVKLVEKMDPNDAARIMIDDLRKELRETNAALERIKGFARVFIQKYVDVKMDLVDFYVDIRELICPGETFQKEAEKEAEKEKAGPRIINEDLSSGFELE